MTTETTRHDDAIDDATELLRLRWLLRHHVETFTDADEGGVLDTARRDDALRSHDASQSTKGGWTLPGGDARLRASAALDRLYDRAATIYDVPAREELIARLMRDGGPWDAP